jgi:hypothetical protein
MSKIYNLVTEIKLGKPYNGSLFKYVDFCMWVIDNFYRLFVPTTIKAGKIKCSYRIFVVAAWLPYLGRI